MDVRHLPQTAKVKLPLDRMNYFAGTSCLSSCAQFNTT